MLHLVMLVAKGFPKFASHLSKFLTFSEFLANPITDRILNQYGTNYSNLELWLRKDSPWLTSLPWTICRKMFLFVYFSLLLFSSAQLRPGYSTTLPSPELFLNFTGGSVRDDSGSLLITYSQVRITEIPIRVCGVCIRNTIKEFGVYILYPHSGTVSPDNYQKMTNTKIYNNIPPARLQSNYYQ